MRVHIPRLGLDPTLDGPVDMLERLAATDRIGEHHLIDEPEASDLILFSQCHMLSRDWRLAAIREHYLARTFPSKVLVYDERDRPWCGFAGVYVSMAARYFQPRFQRAWGYFPTEGTGEPFDTPDLLFSFVGSPSHRCRKPLFELGRPNAVVEEVRGFTFYDPGSVEFEQRRASFGSILGRSRFVLCPRGRGTSSIRLYEVLAAGRVPVIIADDWIAPSGPDWQQFSIRWPEGRTSGLIAALENRDDEWPVMSAAALAAHRQFFSSEVTFHHLVELCRDIHDSTSGRDFPQAGVRGRAFIAAGAEVARWRTTSAVRRIGKKALKRLRLLA